LIDRLDDVLSVTEMERRVRPQSLPLWSSPAAFSSRTHSHL
jgi:hypothetical protein